MNWICPKQCDPKCCHTDAHEWVGTCCMSYDDHRVCPGCVPETDLRYHAVRILTEGGTR